MVAFFALLILDLMSSEQLPVFVLMAPMKKGLVGVAVIPSTVRLPIVSHRAPVSVQRYVWETPCH